MLVKKIIAVWCLALLFFPVIVPIALAADELEQQQEDETTENEPAEADTESQNTEPEEGNENTETNDQENIEDETTNPGAEDVAEEESANEEGTEDIPTENEEPAPDFSVVFINEVNLEVEFIEIWNSGNVELDLSLFQFSELSGNNEKRRNFSGFASNLIIPANGFLLLEMSSKLNNSGEIIRLYEDESSETALQTVEVPSNESGKSFSRLQNGSFEWRDPTPNAPNEPITGETEDDSSSENDTESEAENETDEGEEDGADENSEQNEETQEPIDTSFLVLNEVDLEAEFIELWNSGSEEMDVSNFEFSELSGGNEKRYPFTDFSSPQIIQAGEFLLLEMSSKLNNSGETVRLYISPEATEPFATLEIPKSESGKSYSRKENDVFEWTTPSPGSANIFTENEQEEPTEDTEGENEDTSGGGGGGGNSNTDENQENEPETETDESQNEADLAFIVINEIDLSAEFLELKNTSTTTIDLNNMEFSELSGANEKRHPVSDFTSNTVIEPQGFLMLEMSSKLNNSGETIRLYASATATTPLQEVVVEKYRNGQTYARDEQGSMVATTTPTPNMENIITAPPETNSGEQETKKKKSGFFKLTAQYESVPADDIVVLINEVAFKDSNGDRIELFCAECGDGEQAIDLQGFRLFDDKIFFEFPPETFVRTGNYIVITLKSGYDLREEREYGWEFFSTKNGLTGTDETLILVDSEDFIEDAVCWSNQSGDFSSGEEEDVGYMRSRRQWDGEPYVDLQCFPSTSISGRMSMARRHGADTNQARDFFPTEINTFGAVNPTATATSNEVELIIEKLLFRSEETVLVTIKNIGLQKAELQKFHLSNGKKIFSTFEDIALLPQESANLLIELPAEESFLMLRDAWHMPEDFVCLQTAVNTAPEEENKKKMAIRDFFQHQLWNQREITSCIQMDRSNGGVLVRKGDEDTNGAADFSYQEFVKKDMRESKTLFVNAVLPNPEGKDADQEWLELSSHGYVNSIAAWTLLIGDKMMFLPDISLRTGDVVHLSSAHGLPSLRNSDGSVALISPQGEIYGLQWGKAKDGDVLKWRENESIFQWDSEFIPDPNDGIALIRDSDNDRVPDAIEKLLSSDATTFDAQNTTIRKEYQKILTENIVIIPSTTPEALVLAGQTEPLAKLKFTLHSEIKIMETQADENGMFRAELSEPLEKGNHSVDVLITTANGLKAFRHDTLRFTLLKGIREDELRDMQIVSVLPNPKGKDSGNEQIVLKNTSGKRGYLRSWSFSNGKKIIEIPETFFEKDEEKIFVGKDVVPSLRNSNGTLLLLNFSEQVHDGVEWDKARDDQLIGPGLVWKPKSSSKKATKKSSALKAVKIPKERPIAGNIIFFSEEFIALQTEERKIQYYFFAAKNPQNGFLLHQALDIGDAITLVISPDNEIIGLETQSNQFYLQSILPVYKMIRWRVVPLMTMVCLLGTLLFLGQKREHFHFIRAPFEKGNTV